MISGPVYELGSYQIAVTLLAMLLIEAALGAKQLRWIFAGLVYLTTALWYLVDPVYTPTDYNRFSSSQFDTAFLQVIGFLIAFRMLLEVFLQKTPTSVLRSIDPRQFDRAGAVRLLLLSWIMLWTIGVMLAGFDVWNLMFPLKGRFGGVTMFGRGRYGGATGFLLSSANYIYMVLCSCFGLLFVCSTKRNVRWLMFVMICWTWPMYFLAGTRHLVLAIAMPSIFATLLTKQWSSAKQVLFVAACALLLNVAMLAAIQFRQGGFNTAHQQGTIAEQIQEGHHQGLNMTQELIFINKYQEAGLLPIEWGANYLTHALNFIPRAIWPDKPFVGREFAMLRVGSHRGDVAATISFGMIGQGVANFGPILGPAATAVLLVLLGRWIIRLPTRGFLSFRVLLVLFTFGSLPNLGRDITPLVLWPVGFAYIMVILYERKNPALCRSAVSVVPYSHRITAGRSSQQSVKAFPDDAVLPPRL